VRLTIETRDEILRTMAEAYKKATKKEKGCLRRVYTEGNTRELPASQDKRISKGNALHST